MFSKFMRRPLPKSAELPAECQVCFESFPEMYKVPCGSTVDHLICFGCEQKWREKMPIRNGKRKMSCPTCRQEETGRTMESLERELAALYVSRQAPQSAQEMVANAFEVLVRLPPTTREHVANRILETMPDSLRPSQTPQFCESGRDCRTRSRFNARSKTILKCRTCREVVCCRSCGNCTGCVPLVPSP
jgi:hypothetical protein